MATEQCARCARPWLNEDLSWETLSVDGAYAGILCPDCVTPDERQQIDGDVMELADGAATEAERRRDDP